MLTEKNRQSDLGAEKRTQFAAQVKEREAQIERSRSILKIEQGVLEHRNRILHAQEEINDVRRKLVEIREQFDELSKLKHV